MRGKERVSRSGVGLVELLVALAIGGIVLGVVAAFFGQQARVTRDTQARNEMNIRARAVVEAVVQDIRMAGARAAVDDAGRTAFRRALPCDSADTCIRVEGDASGISRLEVQYVSSLFLEGRPVDGGVEGIVANTCRRVAYDLQGSTLFRSDVDCDAADDLDPGFATEFATDVESIQVSFICNEGTFSVDPSDCFSPAGGFVREGQVTATLNSRIAAQFDVTLRSATATPNMRSFDRFVEEE
jgi:prepilin-type N-terminal cleavage/methylation domain-containing protein